MIDKKRINIVCHRFIKSKATITIMSLSLIMGSLVAQAKELTITFPLSIPPLVIQEKDNGFEVDILREALKYKVYAVKTIYLPAARIPESLKSKTVDGGRRGDPSLKEDTDVYYGNKILNNKNYAFTLKSNHLKIDSFADLKDKSISAFQSASKVLGEDFKNAVKDNPKYKETARQSEGIFMLYANRLQVAVGDINIFNYYTKNIGKHIDLTRPIQAANATLPCLKNISAGVL